MACNARVNASSELLKDNVEYNAGSELLYEYARCAIV